VGEGDLAAARALEVAVDDDAVVGQQLGRDAAHAGGRGDRERALHVGDHAGCRALERAGGRALRRRGRLGLVRGLGSGLGVGLGSGFAAGAAAGGASAGFAAGAGAGAAAAGSAGAAGASVLAAAWLACGDGVLAPFVPPASLPEGS
jgi:hypothetical protein